MLARRARRLFVNLETVEKTHVKGSGELCPRDGWVLFRNSELLAGRLGKGTLGGGNKAGLFQARDDQATSNSDSSHYNFPSGRPRLPQTHERQLKPFRGASSVRWGQAEHKP